jgi:ketosteroid isomerase-like protein
VSDGAVERLVAEAAIRDLVVRYSVAVDDGDVATVVDSFAADGVFQRGDQEVAGTEALRAFFSAASGTYDLARHIVEMHTIDFGGDPGQATGTVHSSAQLVRSDTFHVAAFRYDDRYVLDAGRWRFAHRRIDYLYFLPAAELIEGITSGDRVRLPTITAADAGGA